MAWNEGIDHNEIFSKGNDNWKMSSENLCISK